MPKELITFTDLAAQNNPKISKEILVVEDNLGNGKLFLTQFKEIAMYVSFHVKTNGEEA